MDVNFGRYLDGLILCVVAGDWRALGDLLIVGAKILVLRVYIRLVYNPVLRVAGWLDRLNEARRLIWPVTRLAVAWVKWRLFRTMIHAKFFVLRWRVELRYRAATWRIRWRRPR
jgi:hypothetical protein